MDPNVSSSAFLPVADALAKRLPKRPSPETIWRWRTRGVNGVKLKAKRCGRCWMTTLDNVDEFIREQNKPAELSPETDLAGEALDAALRAAGIL